MELRIGLHEREDTLHLIHGQNFRFSLLTLLGRFEISHRIELLGDVPLLHSELENRFEEIEILCASNE